MSPKRTVLLNPGPVNISERVRSALAKPDLCHREPDFYDLQDRIRQGLLGLFGLDPTRYAAVLITGSGTAALETAVSSAPAPGRGLVVVNNGVYGERIATIARIHGIPVREVVSEWGAAPDLEALERAVAEFVDADLVAVVHHETTTGLINPIDAVGDIARRHGKRLLVDSVSGLFGEAFDFGRNGAAMTVCTANKCLQGVPGIAFVIATREELELQKGLPDRSYYLNLTRYFLEQEHRGTPFTPAVQVAYALEAAIEETREETVAGRISRYRRASALLRKGFQDLGLAFMLPPELRSNTITTLELPRGATYEPLHDHMRDRGYVIYAGQGGLKKRYFRVANMGWITEDELAGCVKAIGEFVRGPACAR